jgi:ubiquinone/menaquinone biosynthesis C-methylase UbiE
VKSVSLKGDNYSSEECAEAERHDALYQGSGESWLLTEIDWSKFDKIKCPLDGYIDSIQKLGEVKGKLVLDLGCGVGWLSVILAKRGAIVDGIEISSVAIEQAQRMAKLNNVAEQTEFQVASAYNLPFEAERFDLVIGQAILHHLDDKSKVATEIYRVLKDDGRAVFFECFGDSSTLERFRTLVPLASEDEEEGHWMHQFKYSDQETFSEYFNVSLKEYHLLSRLDRILSSPRFLHTLNVVDSYLLTYLPFLRRYARTIVIELTKLDKK